MKIYDICGVNNLYGMLGIFGGIVGVIVVVYVDFDKYGYDG